MFSIIAIVITITIIIKQVLIKLNQVLICHRWFCLKVPHMNKVDDIRYDKADSERSKHYKQPEAKSTKGPARKESEQELFRSISILGNQCMFVLDHQRRIDRWL